MIGLPLVILRSLTARENGGRVLFNHLHIDSTGRWKQESGTLPFKRGNDMSAIKSIGAALLVASLTACGGPARFVIQGYPGAELAPAKTKPAPGKPTGPRLQPTPPPPLRGSLRR